MSHLRELCLTQGYKYLQGDMSWVGVSPGGAFVGGGGGGGLVLDRGQHGQRVSGLTLGGKASRCNSWFYCPGCQREAPLSAAQGKDEVRRYFKRSGSLVRKKNAGARNEVMGA